MTEPVPFTVKVRCAIPVVAALTVLCAGPVGRTAAESISSQSTAPAADLFTRVGLTSDEAATALGGRPAVRVLPSGVETEVAVAGAIRVRGDVERLVLWLRDFEQLRRSLGTEVLGGVDTPPSRADFAALPADDADGHAVLVERAASYQKSGDRALDPTAAASFQDMIRRAATLWQLAYPFAVYLEEYPQKRPAEVEDRFYWTRETAVRKPVTTLHHVVLQRLSDRSVRFADKQFYASRDIEAALLVGQATPTADGRSFDLVVSLRARVPKLDSLAARVLRERISREVSDAFAAYLDWIQRSFALG